MQNEGTLVLIVEDEPTFAQTIELYLRHDGYRTERAGTGARALELFRAATPDIVLLDLGLPDIDGFEVLRTMRSGSDVPIVVLTARSEEVDELLGLGLGASDYLAKPVSARKLRARIQVALRVRRTPADGRPLRVGPLEVDPERVEVRVDGTPVALTATEFRVLEHLARSPRRVVTRGELYEAALPDGQALERAVDVHMTNIRRKLRACGRGDLIRTVRGVGYAVDPPPP